MIFICFCAAMLAGAFTVARLAMRAPSGSLTWVTVWPLACLIGALRIAAIVFGAVAYSDPGLAQGPGYFLLMVGLPEILLVRGLRAHPLEWEAAAIVILTASSFAWAAAIVWVANRLRQIPGD